MIRHTSAAQTIVSKHVAISRRGLKWAANKLDREIVNDMQAAEIRSYYCLHAKAFLLLVRNLEARFKDNFGAGRAGAHSQTLEGPEDKIQRHCQAG